MQREFLEELKLEKDVIDKIMKENGNDINKAKGDLEKTQKDLATTKTDLKKAQEDIKNISTEFEGKTAEQWKQEVDKIQADWQTDKENREKAEKAIQLDNDFANRFESITADKKFYNEPTRNDVMSKWRKAREDEANKSKSDSEIYTEVTKDVPGLYQGVQKEVLRGGNPLQPGGTGNEKPVIQKQWNKFSDL